jgi:tetratricopeptide (TPR) repeat protein
MDCRRSLRLACLLLTPTFAAGCTPLMQQTISSSPPTGAQVKKDKDLPKITPKASSCVAGADFYRVEASSPKHSPAERQQFLEQARLGYQQALKIEPNNVAALHGLAQLYVETNDHDRAVATYQKAIKLYPKDASFAFELGMAHARWKEWEAALLHLKAAHDLDPENKQCASMLGHCLARAGRLDEALALFRQTVGEAQAQYNLARMLHHMNRDDLCRRYLESALRADPQLTEARDLLAQLGNQPAAGTAAQ